MPGAHAWPQDCKEAAVVHLHELHIEIPGILVHLFWFGCWFFVGFFLGCKGNVPSPRPYSMLDVLASLTSH